jgi:hypothetical protein
MEWGQRYSSTLSLASALDGVGCQRHVPASLLPEKRTNAHCTGGWEGLRADLDGSGKTRCTGIRTPGPPNSSESLYRLSYSGPLFVGAKNRKVSMGPSVVESRALLTRDLQRQLECPRGRIGHVFWLLSNLIFVWTKDKFRLNYAVVQELLCTDTVPPGSWATRHVQLRRIQALVDYIDVIRMLGLVRRHELKQPAKFRGTDLSHSSGLMREEAPSLGVPLERAVGVCMLPVNN